MGFHMVSKHDLISNVLYTIMSIQIVIITVF